MVPSPVQTPADSEGTAPIPVQMAIEKEPHNAKAYLRLGMALVQKGDLAAARKVMSPHQEFIPHTISIKWFLNVNSPTKIVYLLLTITY